MDLTLVATVVLCLVHGAFTPPAFHALGSTTMGFVPAIFDDLGWEGPPRHRYIGAMHLRLLTGGFRP